jgi:hypothetical protein
MRKAEREFAREQAYAGVAHLNRKERRTAHGRLLVAQAEAAALRAENEILKRQLAM